MSINITKEEHERLKRNVETIERYLKSEVMPRLRDYTRVVFKDAEPNRGIYHNYVISINPERKQLRAFIGGGDYVFEKENVTEGTYGYRYIYEDEEYLFHLCKEWPRVKREFNRQAEEQYKAYDQAFNFEL